MSIRNLSVASACLVAVAACSQPPAAGNAAPGPPQATAAGAPAAASGATTIPIPAGQDVTTTIALPPGTHKVGLATGAAPFSCKHVTITTQNGGYSNDFTDTDVPAKLNMTDSTAAGNTYVSIDISCHGGAADSQFVVTPSG